MVLAMGCSKTDQSGAVEWKEGQPYVQEIEALGYPFAGEPSKDWRKWETVSFDSLGNKTEHVYHWDPTGTTVTTQYDAKGRKIGGKRTSTDQLGGVDYRIQWLEGGLVCVEEEFVHKESRVMMRTTTRRDSSGRLLETITENLQFPEMNGDSLRQTCHYDASGNLILEEDRYQGKTIPSVKYYLDSLGRPFKLERFDSEGKVSRTELLAHDDRGNVIRESAMDAGQSEAQLFRSRKWNDAGLVIEEHRYTGNCTTTGEASGQCRIQETIRHTYDAHGRPLTKDTFREGNTEPVMRLRYSYRPIAH